MDETYVKIKGKSAYFYRAVDKEGHTIDFLLTPNRDRDAAEAFLRKAIRTQGLPEKITIDKSGSNTAAIKHYNKTQKTAIVIRQSSISITSWSRTIERSNGSCVRCWASNLFGRRGVRLPGIEVMHAIRKGQLGEHPGNEHQTPAEQFYALAA